MSQGLMPLNIHGRPQPKKKFSDKELLAREAVHATETQARLKREFYERETRRRAA